MALKARMDVEMLNYPFDPHLILRKKKSLKKELLRQPVFSEKKIAVLGGSTTFEIKEILELFLLKKGIKPLFYESEYGKYYEDVMFENPELKEFSPDVVYIHTTMHNISAYPGLEDSAEIVRSKADVEFLRFKEMWQRIQQTFECSIIQNNFELPPYRMLGNLDFTDIHGKINFIMKLNMEFARFAANAKNFYINDINYLSACFGLNKWQDKSLWYSYKYAMSYDAIPFLSHNVAAIILSIYGRSKKCLTLDLDDTLWGGIIGDDGLKGIQIGNETPLGEAYAEFQRYVKALNERGIILAICSKNDSETAKEGFTHPDSVLTFDDFALFRANWEPKSENVKKAAKELNIGLDSIVFIDDNPAERELVKAQLPDVEVPALGNNIIDYIDILDKSAYFEPAAISDEDTARNRLYAENIKRSESESKFKNYDDYLKTLEMSAEIEAFKPVYLARITQLLNKTNQFNLTGRRYNASEVETVSKNNNYIALYGRLADRFGDNGVVSVIIGSVKERALHIDAWIMSCRVFKREMELAMFDELVEHCKSRRLKKIAGYYLKTSKNAIVEDLYEKLGFDLVSRDLNGNSIWNREVNGEYAKKNNFIRIDHENR